MKHNRIFLTLIILIITRQIGFTQTNDNGIQQQPELQDSLKNVSDLQDSTTIGFQTINSLQDYPLFNDSLKSILPLQLELRKDPFNMGSVYLKLPHLNPADKLQPQFSPYIRKMITPLHTTSNSFLPEIHWDGVHSEFINSKSSTAIARAMPSNRLMIYSSTTLDIVETPFFGKSYYYILNAGAKYAISPDFNMGLRTGFDSDFGIMPTWHAGIDASIMLNPSLMIDGGLTYMSTAGNSFNVAQSAVMADLHGRYRVSNSWYVNAYGGAPINQKSNNPTQRMLPAMNTPYFGGTIEHWFRPNMGVEGGMIWSRDMFTGKMRARPKLELLFRPRK